MDAEQERRAKALHHARELETQRRSDVKAIDAALQRFGKALRQFDETTTAEGKALRAGVEQ